MYENMLPVGTLLRAGAYRIEKQIASGGFGNTYVVRNVKFNNLFAMKEFFMKEINLRNGIDVTVSLPNNKATFETQREKFEKEAVRLYHLNNEHIVKVHDLFDENGTVYYIMDLIDGQSLADIIKSQGAIDEQTALNIFRQMLDALSVLHGQKEPMLHLDIKPSNIMLDKRGNAYLIDFGSSKQIDDTGSLTTVSGFTLSKDYAPLELIGGNKDRIGPWSDLYELGATLYYLLAGIQPPTSSELSIDGEESLKLPESVSSSTRQLIRRMMALAPSKRPKSAAEVLLRLEKTENTGNPGSKESSTDSKKPRGGEKEPVKESGGDSTIINRSRSGEKPKGVSNGETTILNPSGSAGEKESPKTTPQNTIANTNGGSNKKNLFIGLVIGIIAVVCGFLILSNKNDVDIIEEVDNIKDTTETELTNNFEQSNIEASIKMHLDSLASEVSRIKFVQDSKRSSISTLPDSSPFVSDIPNISLLGKIRLLGALDVDRRMLNSQSSTLDYNKKMKELLDDINYRLLNDYTSHGTISDLSFQLYNGLESDGRINLYWHLATATVVEQLYILSQNKERLINVMSDEQVCNITFGQVLILDAINRLKQYDPELVEIAEAIAPLYSINATSTSELKSQIVEFKGDIEYARSIILSNDMYVQDAIDEAADRAKDALGL